MMHKLSISGAAALAALLLPGLAAAASGNPNNPDPLSTAPVYSYADPPFPLFPGAAHAQWVGNGPGSAYNAPVNSPDDGMPIGEPTGWQLAGWYWNASMGEVDFVYMSPGGQKTATQSLVFPPGPDPACNSQGVCLPGATWTAMEAIWSGWDNPAPLVWYANYFDTGSPSGPNAPWLRQGGYWIPAYGAAPTPQTDIGLIFAVNPPTPQLAQVMAADGFDPSPWEPHPLPPPPVNP